MDQFGGYYDNDDYLNQPDPPREHKNCVEIPISRPDISVHPGLTPILPNGAETFEKHPAASLPTRETDSTGRVILSENKDSTPKP